MNWIQFSTKNNNIVFIKLKMSKQALNKKLVKFANIYATCNVTIACDFSEDQFLTSVKCKFYLYFLKSLIIIFYPHFSIEFILQVLIVGQLRYLNWLDHHHHWVLVLKGHAQWFSLDWASLEASLKDEILIFLSFSSLRSFLLQVVLGLPDFLLGDSSSRLDWSNRLDQFGESR